MISHEFTILPFEVSQTHVDRVTAHLLARPNSGVSRCSAEDLIGVGPTSGMAYRGRRAPEINVIQEHNHVGYDAMTNLRYSEARWFLCQFKSSFAMVLYGKIRYKDQASIEDICAHIYKGMRNLCGGRQGLMHNMIPCMEFIARPS